MSSWRSSTRPIPTTRSTAQTVQTVLDELGAGDKPRLVALNKADLIERAANDPAAPGRAVSGAVLVSALTGYGIDALRAEIAALLASLWVDVDTAVPYSAGELLARVRERGTVELEYGERDVHVRGRIAPTLAGELEAVAAQLVGVAQQRNRRRNAGLTRGPGSARRTWEAARRRAADLVAGRGRSRATLACKPCPRWPPRGDPPARDRRRRPARPARGRHRPTGS